MAEGPLDEVQRLEADLQAYAAEFKAPSVTMWLTLVGGLARWAETPSRVLSGALDTLRKSVQSIASYDLVGRSDRRPTKSLLEASDPDLVLLKSGSLRIGLRWYHSGQASLIRTEEGAVEKALETVIRAVEELETRGVNALADENPNRRRVILRAVAQLAPTSRSEVEGIALSGPQVATPAGILLTARTNQLARAAIREVLSPTETSYDGEVRELDLDRRTFWLRGVKDVGEVHCMAVQTFELRRELLESSVRVFGSQDAGSQRRMFLVTDMEPLEQ